MTRSRVTTTVAALSILFLAVSGPAIAEQEKPANTSGIGAYTCKKFCPRLPPVWAAVIRINTP